MVLNATEGVVQLSGKGYVDRRRSNRWDAGEYRKLVNTLINDEGYLINRPGTLGVQTDRPVGNPVWPLNNGFLGWAEDYPVTTSGMIHHPSTSQEPLAFFMKDSVGPAISALTNATAQNNMRTAVPSTAYPAGYPTGSRTGETFQVIGWFSYPTGTGRTMYYITRYSFSFPGVGRVYVNFIWEDGFTDLTQKQAILSGTYSTSSFTKSMVLREFQFNTSAGSFNEYRASVFELNHFIFKERLWYTQLDTLYFSAATDLANMQVPDGGFQQFPTQEIKCTVAINDAIYVFCDNSIYLYSYDSDPNLDSQVVLVSDRIGADSATVVGQTIYFYKGDSIYIIDGTNIRKVADLNLGANLKLKEYSTSASASILLMPSVKLVGTKDALFLLYRYIATTPGTDSNTTQESPGAIPLQGYYVSAVTDPTSDPSYLYRISLTNGSVSEYKVGAGYPADIWVTPVEDQNNTHPMYIAECRQPWPWPGSGAAPSNYYYGNNIHIYTPELSVLSGGQLSRNYFVDVINDTATQTLKYQIPEIDIQIPTISPDNLKYFMKKFRHLLIEADWPYLIDSTLAVLSPSLSVTVGLDAENPGGTAFSTDVIKELVNTNNSTAVKGSAAYRYGINQRAKELGLRIYMAAITANLGAFSYSNIGTFTTTCFQISDIRTLWTYTGRGPVGYTNDKS